MEIIDNFKELKNLDPKKLDILFDEFRSNPMNSISAIAILEKRCTVEKIDIGIAKKFYTILSVICEIFINAKSIDAGIKEFEEDFVVNYPDETNYIWDYFKKNFHQLNEFVIRRKEYLLSSISNSLEKFHIVCDVRPVYDISREKIEKYIFPIILSITYSDSDNKLIVELDEDDLEKMKKEIDIAFNKFKMLKDKFSHD